MFEVLLVVEFEVVFEVVFVMLDVFDVLLVVEFEVVLVEFCVELVV